MGYYTSYNIKIFNDPKEEVSVKLSEISWEAESILSFNDLSHKWYNREEDVLTVSKLFPEAIIEIEGQGEEHGDEWIERYRNGELEGIRPIVIWPEFERIVIEPTDESSKEETKSGEESEVPLAV